MDLLEELCRELTLHVPAIALADRYHSGKTAISYLSPEDQRSLGNKLRTLSVNFCALVVQCLSERLTVQGFQREGQPLPRVWEAWERNGMEDQHKLAHVEALVAGRSFVMVWSDAAGKATITVEHPSECAVIRDPLTREPIAGLKRWNDPRSRKARAFVFEPHKITEYVSAADCPPGSVPPDTGYNTVQVINNPLGVVPLVPFVNRTRLLDFEGSPEFANIIDLQDALTKVLTDMMITSEYYSKPKRWATGLAIREDEDGNPIDPFIEGPNRVWQSEDPQTRFGEFSAASLAGYKETINVFAQLICAMTSLPPSYVLGDVASPTSADQIRATEAGLVAKCEAKQSAFGPSWARVGALVSAVENNSAVPERVEACWADPATRTLAQTSDAVSKLHASGLVSTETAQSMIGMSPDQITADRRARARQTLDTAPSPRELS